MIYRIILFSAIGCFFCGTSLAKSKLPISQSKHCIYGCPTGTPETNNLIIRNIYALSSNDETKFADWVAYRLDNDTVNGKVKTHRRWKADPLLDETETLEPEDFRGAYKALGVDRGHQAPLGSFKGTDNWADTNYLCNITPQMSALNRGVWRSLEGKVRNLCKKGQNIYVITGTLYEKEMPSLPNADEPHKIPSGYWKIVLVEPGESISSIKAASFIFEQDTGKKAKVIEHLTTINVVEKRSGLDFLTELPDDVEEEIEDNQFEGWARGVFGN